MIYEETKIQQAIVRAIRYMHPKSLVWSTPNEGKRSDRLHMALAAAGLMHGVSDLICIKSSKVYFLEVKTERGKQTEHHVVRSAEEALNAINNKNNTNLKTTKQ